MIQLGSALLIAEKMAQAERYQALQAEMAALDEALGIEQSIWRYLNIVATDPNPPKNIVPILDAYIIDGSMQILSWLIKPDGVVVVYNYRMENDCIGIDEVTINIKYFVDPSALDKLAADTRCA